MWKGRIELPSPAAASCPGTRLPALAAAAVAIRLRRVTDEGIGDISFLLMSWRSVVLLLPWKRSIPEDGSIISMHECGRRPALGRGSTSLWRLRPLRSAGQLLPVARRKAHDSPLFQSSWRPSAWHKSARVQGLELGHPGRPG